MNYFANVLFSSIYMTNFSYIILDFIDYLSYIIYIMNNNSDKELIEHLLSWAKYHRFSLAEMSRLVGRTKQWGSLLDKGRINKLQSETRNNIKFILGDQ